ncbi:MULTISPECIES: hypothetical protein [Streptomyces]|uniref:hypothetical protein n=1 Tax=Streptomyces TaxID=1883 RepID=UPI0006F6F24E|nr:MULTISPECIES: hypothetical protein [Streptomyces]KQX94584.1 hypothetical protein ASD26_19145 [Streptomyces sp. Root1319]KQZ05453.1 hypothetical protein ASD51_13745 [Streptomyces sp. Root55]RPK73389.1 hypothetical protein EES45_31040 [Streptomyces sp. ADI97-07]WRY80695.1 hypothetical protein OG388_05445 [Streptomyces clavifer]WUC26476.1 hypothetical protein OG927_03470 [Streptomyces clavifer]
MTGTRWATASVCPATAVTTCALSENDAGHTGPAASPIASVLVVVAEVCASPAISVIAGTHEPQL